MARAPLTFPQLLLLHAEQRPDATALREKQLGIWQSYTWSSLLALVRSISAGLAEAGLVRGAHIIVIGANRPRLYASMLAAQSLGAIPVPLYQDATAAELAYPICNAEVGFAIVEDQEQVDKLLEVREHYPDLKRIWYDDARGMRAMREPGLEGLDALVKRGSARDRAAPAQFLASVANGKPQDIAALFFTSGTTGNPKGVMHSYAALIDRSKVAASFDGLTDKEEILAYLPPAWVGQNIFSYALWLVVGYVVNCPESSETVGIDMKEVGPTYYFAPPRVFEGFLTSITIRMEDASVAKRWLFKSFMKLAFRVGGAVTDRKSVGLLDRCLYRIGDFIIYGPLRNALGMSRVRVAYTAGEAIGPDLFEFYRSIGINLKQLYGSTETAVFVCLQPDHQVRADTVGVPITGVEVRISEGGEVLIKSPGLLKGYYKNQAATNEVLDPTGWYRTGDAGFLAADGHLKIIDRVKDVGRLASGEMFAPKYVENKLKFFPYIKEAVAFGDRREKVCVFINIDFNAVGSWAERCNLPYAGYADLAAKREVYELIKDCVEKVNTDLARDDTLSGCQIHRFLVLHKELDADDGELTRTNKVRRGSISEKYAELIGAMYDGRRNQFIEATVKFEDGRTGVVTAHLRIEDVKTVSTARIAA